MVFLCRQWFHNELLLSILFFDLVSMARTLRRNIGLHDFILLIYLCVFPSDIFFAHIKFMDL